MYLLFVGADGVIEHGVDTGDDVGPAGANAGLPADLALRVLVLYEEFRRNCFNLR